MIRDMWRARGLIWEMVKRDLRGRYAGSTLGMTWAIIQPFVMIAVYTLALNKFAGDRGTWDVDLPKPWNYVIPLCIGIFVWNLFQECTNRSANTFVEHANLIKKVAFPETILPVVIICSSLIRFGVEIALYTVLVVAIGYSPGWVILSIPVILTLQVLFTFGLALSLATLNVFLRDIGHITSVGLFVLFWMTPIVVVQTAYPSWYQRTLLRVHPIHYIIAMWRDVYARHVLPDFESFLSFGVMALLTMAAGVTIYRRLYREIPDLI